MLHKSELPVSLMSVTTAGDIVAANRSALTTDNVDKLIFLEKKNKKQNQKPSKLNDTLEPSQEGHI